MFSRFSWILALALVVGPILGLLTTGILSYISPKLYESTAVLQVTSNSPNGQASFFPTEFEVIRAEKTLDLTIAKLDLDNHWGVSTPDARTKLRKMIHTTNIRGTDLIEIRVQSTNAEDAVRITNSISDSYRARRVELENTLAAKAVEKRRAEVREQENVVEEKRKTLIKITRDELLRSKSPATLTAERIKLKSQFDALGQYEGEALMTYAADIDRPENTVRTVFPQYLEAKRTLAALKLGGVAADHPNMIQQEEITASLMNKLEQGVLALRETIKAQITLVDELLISDDADTRSEATQTPIDEAKANLEGAKTLLEKRKAELLKERTTKRQDPVIVHSHPDEAPRAASPGLLITLLFGAGKGLVVGLISALILIPILNTIVKPKAVA